MGCREIDSQDKRLPHHCLRHAAHSEMGRGYTHRNSAQLSAPIIRSIWTVVGWWKRSSPFVWTTQLLPYYYSLVPPPAITTTEGRPSMTGDEI